MFGSVFLLLFVTGCAISCNTAPSKRPTEGCAEVERVINLTLRFCGPSDGSDAVTISVGFTWAEIENFGKQLHITLGDTVDGFVMIDENRDGVLTVEEWQQFEEC
eukprot:GFUD01010416.1.p1 GENE.GFUD01010416.1~~GFUD01010416.1.p1  ORF type:complete len:105 (+),score=16.58 GFUD01010416.1:52-366(+)